MNATWLRPGTVIVLIFSFLTYTGALYLFPETRGPVMDARATSGKWLWQKHNCGACHQVYGLGGFLGPDLTNVYSRRGEAYIRAMLPSGINSMPAFQLSETETENLLAYLKHLDGSGIADPRKFIIDENGVIHPQHP